MVYIINGSDMDGQVLAFFYVIDHVSAMSHPRLQICAEFSFVRKPVQDSL
jgi:hypothetical protein